MLIINHVTKAFKTNRQSKIILDNIKLKVTRGTWCTVMGPSGVGKSTLLNCISGQLKPDKGSILIGDTTINDLNDKQLSHFRRKNIGFVFQDFKLLPHYSVLDNVILPLLYDERKNNLETRAIKLLKEVGISQDLFHRLPTHLSGGEKQRVAIARSLIAEPQLLLCDEPTGNLDTDNRDQIIDLLLKFKEKKQTLVVVTHDEEVAKHGDICYELIDGSLKEKGLIR